MSYFADWLDALSTKRGRKVTQLEASKLLGISHRQAQVYYAGVSQHTGAHVIIPYATTCLMDQLARGETPRPWKP